MTAYEFTDRIRAMEGKLYRSAKAHGLSDADCGDALGETALKAWQKQRTLRDESLFEAWLMRILINICRDMRRAKKTLPLDEALAKADETPMHDSDLYTALMALPEKYRLPVLMHYMEGYSVAETATALTLPVSTVKWRMHEARKRLKMAIEEVG